MHGTLRRVRRFMIAFVASLIALGGGASAETLVGTNVDSRIVIGFDLPVVQVQKYMPKGWQAIALPSGPLAGATLLMGLEERLHATDAEGKPAGPPTSRAVAFMGLARQEGGKGVRLYVLRLYTSADGYDPFGNAVAAKVTRKSVVEGTDNAGRRHDEKWEVVLGNGEALVVDAGFVSGRGSWGSATTRVYSNTEPGVSRIFKYDQLVELSMSAAAKVPLKGEIKVTTTIPELNALFRGGQKLVGVMNIPVYLRKVFVP